jgi:hypothetical protein
MTMYDDQDEETIISAVKKQIGSKKRPFRDTGFVRTQIFKRQFDINDLAREAVENAYAAGLILKWTRKVLGAGKKRWNNYLFYRFPHIRIRDLKRYQRLADCFTEKEILKFSYLGVYRLAKVALFSKKLNITPTEFLKNMKIIVPQKGEFYKTLMCDHINLLNDYIDGLDEKKALKQPKPFEPKSTKRVRAVVSMTVTFEKFIADLDEFDRVMNATAEIECWDNPIVKPIHWKRFNKALRKFALRVDPMLS